MTAFALVSGKLFKAPESKTSKAGKPFAVARLKEGEGDAATWWEVLAFGDTASADLLRLKAGDGVAVNGAFKAELYTAKDGEVRIQNKIFVDNVISIRKQPRPPKDRREPAGPPPSGPDDDLPF